MKTAALFTCITPKVAEVRRISCLSCHVVMQRKTNVLSHSSSDASKADGCTVCDLLLLLLTGMLQILLLLYNFESVCQCVSSCELKPFLNYL